GATRQDDRAAARTPVSACRDPSAPRLPVPVADRHDPLRAIHGRAGEQSDAGPLPALPHARRLRGRRPRGTGTRDPQHGVLPREDAGDSERLPDAPRAVRRGSPAHPRGPRAAGRGGPENGQRRPQRLWRSGHRGRHARPEARAPAGADRARRPRQDRAGPHGGDPQSGVEPVLAQAHLLWAGGVRRATAAVPLLPAPRPLPVCALRGIPAVDGAPPGRTDRSGRPRAPAAVGAPASGRAIWERPKARTMTGLLGGKTALVMGVANRWSIAWAVAQACSREGGRLVFTFQGARQAEDVRERAASLAGWSVRPCDVGR